MTPETETTSSSAGSNGVTAVTQQSPVPLRQANQIQVMGDKDVAEEVVPEEAVTKDVAEEADA